MEPVIYPILKLDESLSDSVIGSVQDSFRKYFGIEVYAGEVVQNKVSNVEGDFTGTIGMIQEALEAWLTISFNKNELVYLLKNIYPAEELNNIVTLKDSVGEIINFIYGLVKTSLNQRGYSFRMTIPTVITGEKHQLHQFHSGYCMHIPFSMDNGGFNVHILLQRIGD